MLPLGHLTFAYLWYAVFAVVGRHRFPARLALVPLAFGSQFPDLIDKPLAYIEVLTYGRSLAHSVFTFVGCTVLVWWVARQFAERWDPESTLERLRVVSPTAFAIGYLSHLVGDSYQSILAGNPTGVRFLLYPLFSLPESPADDIAPWIRMIRIYQETTTHPQITVIVAAGIIFLGVRIHQYWSQWSDVHLE